VHCVRAAGASLGRVLQQSRIHSADNISQRLVLKRKHAVGVVHEAVKG